MDKYTLVADLLRSLNHLKLSLLEFLPNLVGALFILLIGFLIARAVRALILRFLLKLHHFIPNQRISHNVQNFIAEKPISKVLGGILYWFLIFFFLTLATETLGLPVMSAWLSGVVGYLPKILSAALIAIAGVLAGVILRDLITTATTSAGIVYGQVLGKMVQAVVLLVTILIGVDLMGVDVTLLGDLVVVVTAALLLGASLAFGFGARTSVSNILASYYLQKIYKVGDNIRIGEKEGQIVEIIPFAVIIAAREGRICIPAREFNQHSSVLVSKELK